MLSNAVLQSVTEGLINITRRDIRVAARDGRLIAGAPYDPGFDAAQAVEMFVYSPADTQTLRGCQFFKVYDGGVAEYVVTVPGEDEETFRVGRLAAFHIQSLSAAYKERADRDNFIKNLLLDNLLLVDVYSRAKKLGIENNARRAVYLIETEDGDAAAAVVRNIFPSKQKDFVTALDENNIILVKELRDKDKREDVERNARAVCDTLAGETLNRARIAIGSPVTDLRNVSASYKEARMALEVGKIFESEKDVVNYETLGLGRLIYQLPPPLCGMFAAEALGGADAGAFDEETLATVGKFFESNLNVSVAARDLYIHRNTLVYRLDKLQKATGLDLRRFDDAMLFKITLMIDKYMRYKGRKSQ
jgi:carbohydrate diacid regulator